MGLAGSDKTSVIDREGTRPGRSDALWAGRQKWEKAYLVCFCRYQRLEGDRSCSWSSQVIEGSRKQEAGSRKREECRWEEERQPV